MTSNLSSFAVLLATSLLAYADYPVQPVPAAQVQIAPDNFWFPRLETNRSVTVDHNFMECEKTGRIDNFRKASGDEAGYFEGLRFNDSDVYKAIEGACYVLAEKPAPQLDTKLDALIATIAKAQRPDGYLYTARIASNNPAKPVSGIGDHRWSLQQSHESYCLGHLFEAGVAHYEATGKRSLLDVAIKAADLLVNTFGPDKLELTDGHEEVEIGLVKLYRTTNNTNYLALAEFFLEERGKTSPARPKTWGKYYQDAKPIRDETQAVGHAVRAAYLYMAMADVAALTDDQQYISVLKLLWEDVAGKKLYVTGGIGGGSREGFSAEYDLPNLDAYNETCSSIANILWQQRMFQLTSDAKYVDVLERCLYNSFLSGIAMTGDQFFYPNRLATVDGEQRQPWFPCACCPPNVLRFIPQVPELFYATKPGELFVNLYGTSAVTFTNAGADVELSQVSNYPWGGQVRLEVKTAKPVSFKLNLRIPGWIEKPLPSDLYSYADTQLASARLKVNGKTVPVERNANGYAILDRSWKNGDVIELELPMPVRQVVAKDKVESCRDRVAILRGPIVYCAEGPDNAGKVDNVIITGDTQLTAESKPGLLNGVTVLRGETKHLVRQSNGSLKTDSGSLTLIPYYAWAHRGKAPMCVWFASNLDAAATAAR
jgi:DUF1680 family protein